MKKILVIIILVLSLFSCWENKPFSDKKEPQQNYFVVAPHHSITAKNLDKFYYKISQKYKNIENIVIISPNHYGEGTQFLESFKKEWKYCFWEEKKMLIEGEDSLNCIKWWKFNFYNYEKSELYDLVDYEKNTLFEHWIWEHFRYINKYFSDYKKVFPVVIKIENDEKFEKTKQVFDKLKNNNFWKTNTLFIVSVDFSHHTFEKVAVFHDLNSVIELNKKKFEKAEVDCPNCLYLAKNLAKENSKNIFKLYNRTSSSKITNKKLLYENTTHIFWEFIQGNISKKQNIKKQNITFFDKLWLYKILKTEEGKSSNNKETNNFISGMFFWDTQLTRSFTYKKAYKSYNIPKSYTDKRKYLDCFYQNKDINKNPKSWKNRFFYGFDFVWVNFETASCEKKYIIKSEKTIKFLTDIDYIKNFKEIWINLYNLANNHSYDYWKVCYQQTKKNFEKQDLNYFAEWLGKESVIYKTEKNWVKVAFIWINDTTYYWNLKEKLEKIKKLKKQWFKIILNIHWWIEYKIKNNEHQKKLAYKFIDSWVDMIIWHHPHSVQNIEIYKNKPIFYSLWNFIFDQVFDETIKWMWVVYLIWEKSLRFNEIYFDRDKKDWVAALENQKAIYLISDTFTGKMYVGSAIGDNGMLLQRWRSYINNGHGGNKELVEVIAEEGLEYVKKNFIYSILENYNSRVNNDYILRRESWWKITLGTRKFGYNSNW